MLAHLRYLYDCYNIGDFINMAWFINVFIFF